MHLFSTQQIGSMTGFANQEDEYESCSNARAFKKLCFALVFFNALILERRKFGAVGWNIPYEWMNSDLKAAMMQVCTQFGDYMDASLHISLSSFGRSSL